jgi:hypothetical protein
MKAIQTYYNGYRFRSRLEARWAVFFDALGIPYRYELQGYDVGVAYLPDFYLPANSLYFEVKPYRPSHIDFSKGCGLCCASRRNVYIVEGDPYFPRAHRLYFRPWGEHSPGEIFNEHEGNPRFDIADADSDGYIGCNTVPQLQWLPVGYGWMPIPPILPPNDGIFRTLVPAMLKARQCRFEHGEYPSRP